MVGVSSIVLFPFSIDKLLGEAQETGIVLLACWNLSGGEWPPAS